LNDRFRLIADVSATAGFEGGLRRIQNAQLPLQEGLTLLPRWFLVFGHQNQAQDQQAEDPSREGENYQIAGHHFGALLVSITRK
jgi:hypothetical protein